MVSIFKEFYLYCVVHFRETQIVEGNKRAYFWWAIKRIFYVLIYGRDKAAGYLFDQDITVKNKFGLFYIPANTDFVLTVNSKSEAGLVSYFTMAEGKTFLDIGANAGKYSIMLAKQSPKNRIISFEPTQFTYQVLEKNIAINQIASQVKAFNLGLSDQKDELSFAKHINQTGLNYLIPNGKLPNPEEFEVTKIKVASLDEILIQNQVNISNIALVKIDVEGHEFRVLKGATQTLTQLSSSAKIMVEIHQKNTAKAAIMDYLKSFDFDCKQLDDENYLFHKA